jgi:hypothetical protein
LEEIAGEGTTIKIVYQAYKLPWPLSNRDLVMIRAAFEEDGVFYQIDVSANHADRPADYKGNVRADLISCYRYEPSDNGCTATYCVFMDPRGNIPTAVLNSSSAKVAARVQAFRSVKI